MRLFAILGIILLLSSIYWAVLAPPTTQPEMIWLIVGEKMAQGNLMYRDILDDTGPLAAATYWLLHIAFGKSLIAHKIIAGIILFVQIIYINQLFNRYKSFDESTYVPAFVAGVLVHASFDLLSLSPALMGSTFILFSLGQLFSQTVLQKEGNDSVLLTGIFAGIALCFHFPLIFFLPYMLFMGVIISGFTFKQILLSLTGYILPFLICSTYYFWQDAFPDFLSKYILTSRNMDIYVHVRLRDTAILYAAPILFSFLGVILGSVIKSLTVNQQKQLQLMLLFFIFGAASFLLTNRRAPYQFVILLTPFAYFISMLFLAFRKKTLTNGLSISFITLVPLIGYGWLLVKTSQNSLDTYGVYSKEKHMIAKGKKVLVLGDDLAYYKNAKQVTPYLNFHLSKDVLSQSQKPKEIALAYKNLRSEMPELIVDPEGIFEGFLKFAPTLKETYRKEGQYFHLK
ncbi:hypothetical protein [Cecembia sp.]|uniref:hypothetical protein n=1 Tax=Cecembia sp. TaxID=1898110 RepID=UPI0025B8B07F|nr:hypothetical protein [Cecembia sp.]